MFIIFIADESKQCFSIASQALCLFNSEYYLSNVVAFQACFQTKLSLQHDSKSTEVS